MKIRLLLISLFISFSWLFLPSSVRTTEAQTSVKCGDIIEGQFAKDGKPQEYKVALQSGDHLVIDAEVTGGKYQDLKIDVGVYAPNGFQIKPVDAEWRGVDFLQYITDALSVAGNYSVRVAGRTITGGPYKMHIGCLRKSGTVISNSNRLQAISCGSIIENHLVRNREFHRYFIALSAGDKARISAQINKANYQDLKVSVGAWAPSGFQIKGVDAEWRGQEQDEVNLDSLAETGIYGIGVDSLSSNGGSYRISVGCTLKDGTAIGPGDNVSPTAQPGNTPQPVPQPASSGVGFPGLPPVDFSKVAKIPLTAGTPMSGAITPTGGEILGYVLDGKANAVADLTFTRLSGNLNLGIVALSPDNKVVFQASLVTSKSLSTQFTLPSDGQYTIGVFRIDLLPPGNPAPTAFQVQAQVSQSASSLIPTDATGTDGTAAQVVQPTAVALVKTSAATGGNSCSHDLPTNRASIPACSRRLGEFAVEGYCNNQGYGVKLINNGRDWACTNKSTGATVFVLKAADFDKICQSWYRNPQAFAIKDQGKPTEAYNWSCYEFTDAPGASQPTLRAVDCVPFPPRLTIGQKGRVLPGDPNRLNKYPRLSRNNNVAIDNIPGGDVFTVLDGPECADGIRWWKVQWHGIVGWTGEADGNAYWVEPGVN